MRFWRRKQKPQPTVDTVFRKMNAVVFPGGEQQIASETTEVVTLLNGTVSGENARDILVHAKGRALIAVQSSNDINEVVQTCTDSVLNRSEGILDRDMAEKVVDFVFRRLIDQQNKEPKRGNPASWTEMGKEEALEVARLTAYRLARHQGRTNAASQQVYTVDPVAFITATVRHFLTDKRYGHPDKIETAQDARELALNVTGVLVMIYAVKKHGTVSTLDSQDIERLAHEELNRTLDLVRNEESVRHYSDYDPSEARAAHEVRVPFNVALTLGETGLLRDPPDPTSARHKILNDVVDKLRNN